MSKFNNDTLLTNGSVIVTKNGPFVITQTKDGRILVSLDTFNRWNDDILYADFMCSSETKNEDVIGSTANFNFVKVREVKKNGAFEEILDIFPNAEKYYRHKFKNENNTCCKYDINKEENDEKTKTDIDEEALRLLLPAITMIANDEAARKSPFKKDFTLYELIAKHLVKNKEKFLK